MAGIKLTSINNGAKLLQGLAKKSDYDGDGKLSTWDIANAAGAGGGQRRNGPNPPAAKPTLDVATQNALKSAVSRAQAHSKFEVKDIVAGIEDVRKKLVALDADKN